MPVVRKRLLIPAFILTFLIYIIYDSIKYDDYPPEPPPPPTPNFDNDIFVDEPVHWHKIPERYPVKQFIEIPTGNKSPIPKIQYDFPKEKTSDRRKRLERQSAVKEAFLHAWTGYKTHAWLKDEVLPISGGYVNSFSGWAATLVDALDTLLIMGLDEEFQLALDAIEQIDFTTTTDKSINVFETTIRYMGGFLAAYDLSGGKYPIILKKAKQDAGVTVGLEGTRSLAGTPMRASPNTLLAEVGSLSLEFTRLTQLTGDPKYYDAIQRLWPMIVDLQNLKFQGSQYTLGGMADSTYEYLPKEHLMLGGSTNQYRRMYEKSIEPIKKNLLFRPMVKDNVDILFSGTRNGNTLDYEGQHLTCFIGGMFAIGAKIFDRPEDLKTAEQLVDGCIWAYDAMPTSLMPEIFKMIPCEDLDKCSWDEKKWLAAVAKTAHINALDDETIHKFIKDAGLPPGMTRVADGKYILRPEAIESVYIMYRITGDNKYQEAAWRMFSSIEKMTRTAIAHASIKDVRFTDSMQVDKMESFWLAETLKYFYLIFSEPGLVSLDDYVLNTEAHPFRRPA
uniref:alpha-1,2-Mannosidase n=1 Tax=Talaromyces marneffei PM1 TaxID=1077442 RepID=A0A093VK55_TALMA